MEIIFITFFQLFLLTVDRRQGDIQVKKEGVGRDRRQNKTQTASDFLWILNIEKQTAVGTKTGLSVNIRTSGPSSCPGDTRMGLVSGGVQDDS